MKLDVEYFWRNILDFHTSTLQKMIHHAFMMTLNQLNTF